jgi:hypothetical protein
MVLWSELIWLRVGASDGSCVHDIGILGSINCRPGVSRRAEFHGVIYIIEQML